MVPLNLINTSFLFPQITPISAIGLSSLLAPRYPYDLMLGGSSPRNHLAKKKKAPISIITH